KLYAENKTAVILYLFLLTGASALLLGSLQSSVIQAFLKAGEGSYGWRYGEVITKVWPIFLIVITVSFIITIHWGTRHFTYSPQSYHYNTLPITRAQKFWFIFSYVFLLLPIIHSIIFIPVTIGVSTLNNVAEIFGKTPAELYWGMLYSMQDEHELKLIYAHLPVFIALFLVVAFFFRKMGFIKTVAASFILGFGGGLFFAFLNEMLWDARGDFGSEQSYVQVPELYTLHFACMAVLVVALLYVIYLRLSDKNY
ncbi:MAG TPA: hypothetical protein VEC12_15990, partial [Bacteroidia bacterium]|nr:hypothetical protein [Bacteroidia bacterium]